MDASLLCMLRCLTHSLFRLQDEYLVSNSCAILHNLASSLTAGLLLYTAERLVKVTCQLCLRAARVHDAREKVESGAQSRTVTMFDPRYSCMILCRLNYAKNNPYAFSIQKCHWKRAHCSCRGRARVLVRRGRPECR